MAMTRMDKGINMEQIIVYKDKLKKLIEENLLFFLDVKECSYSHECKCPDCTNCIIDYLQKE